MTKTVVEYQIKMGMGTKAPVQNKSNQFTVVNLDFGNGRIIDATHKNRGYFAGVNVLQGSAKRQDKHTAIYEVYSDGTQAQLDSRCFWQSLGFGAQTLELKFDIAESSVEQINEDFEALDDASDEVELAEVKKHQVKSIVLHIPAEDVDGCFEIQAARKDAPIFGYTKDIVLFHGEVEFSTARYLSVGQRTNFDPSKLKLKATTTKVVNSAVLKPTTEVATPVSSKASKAALTAPVITEAEIPAEAAAPVVAEVKEIAEDLAEVKAEAETTEENLDWGDNSDESEVEPSISPEGNWADRNWREAKEAEAQAKAELAEGGATSNLW